MGFKQFLPDGTASTVKCTGLVGYPGHEISLDLPARRRKWLIGNEHTVV